MGDSLKFNGIDCKKVNFNGTEYYNIIFNGDLTKLERNVVISETLTLTSELVESISTTTDNTDFNEKLMKTYTIPAGATINSATIDASVKLKSSAAGKSVSETKTGSYDLLTSNSGTLSSGPTVAVRYTSGKSNYTNYVVRTRASIGFSEDSLLSISDKSGFNSSDNFSGGDTMSVISAGKTFAVGFHLETSVDFQKAGAAETATGHIEAGSTITININYTI